MARLLVDQMCGTLVSYLRFCGHDTRYTLDDGIESDDEIESISIEDSRRLITRDRSLAARLDDAILIESVGIEGQLGEVCAVGIELELTREPSRCGRCNGLLVREWDASSIPAYVPDTLDGPLFVCQDCGQYFWIGSHWTRVKKTIDRARSKR